MNKFLIVGAALLMATVSAKSQSCGILSNPGQGCIYQCGAGVASLIKPQPNGLNPYRNEAFFKCTSYCTVTNGVSIGTGCDSPGAIPAKREVLLRLAQMAQGRNVLIASCSGGFMSFRGGVVPVREWKLEPGELKLDLDPRAPRPGE